MKLSARLQALRNLYLHQSTIWDIGCDHAQLGLSFMAEEKVEAIHLVDPAAAVIATLKEHIDSYITKGKKNIYLHHLTGQQIQLVGTSKCIFIAGMGGSEIIQILAQIIPQMGGSDRVIISPHSKIPEVRGYLQHSSLRLVAEKVLHEKGQFYQVLCLNLDEQMPVVSAYGQDIWIGDVGQRYRQHLLLQLSRHQDEESRRFWRWLSQ